ncbi:MAG: TlpA disulfide reductase family protein [Kofleriaceae bacterium]
MRAVVVAGLLAIAGPAAADTLRVGDKLAELDVGVDGNGKAFKLKAIKGKWILVTVGASWCKPCAKELPTWDKLAGLLKDKITFVAINIDNEVDIGKKFNAKLKIRNMKVVYMPADKSAVAERYGSDTMPTTFVAENSVVKFVKPKFEDKDADGEYKKLKAKLDELIK